MRVNFTYWKEADEKFLGYLNEFPDQWTQGESLADLQEHLKDLLVCPMSEKLIQS